MPKVLTYTPILRNRQVELKAIDNVLGASSEFLRVISPLMEIIQDKTRSNSTRTFIDDICDMTEKYPSAVFMVDIDKRQPNSSMAPAVRRFLFETSRNADYVKELFRSLLQVNRAVIPVVSLASPSPHYERYHDDASWLHEEYPDIMLAYRVPLKYVEALLPLIEAVAKSGETIILDIADTADPMHALVRRACGDISKLASEFGMRFMIMDDPRPQSLLNKHLENDAPIFSIGTSLKVTYRLPLNADGFGDYAGIASTYPSTGGAISPAAVFYNPQLDVFVGFRGVTSNLYEFENIAKSIVNSDAWGSLSQKHRDECPGCKCIRDCAKGDIGHGSQASWKRYTMEHYLYSMGEYMLRENES